MNVVIAFDQGDTALGWFSLHKTREGFEDGSMPFKNQVQAFDRSFLRRVQIRFRGIERGWIITIDGRYLQELKKVTVDNQLDLPIVLLTLSRYLL